MVLATFHRPAVLLTAILLPVAAVEARFIVPVALAVAAVLIVRTVAAVVSITEAVVLLAVAAELPVAVLPIAATVVITVAVVALIVLAVRLPLLVLMGLAALRSTTALAFNRLLRTWICLMRGSHRAKLVRRIRTDVLVAALVHSFEAFASRLSARLIAWHLELLAIGHDDAVVMLRMLEIVLGKHPVTGRLRVPRQCHVFFRDVRRRSPDLHIRTVRLKAARQRVLTLAALALITLMIAAIIAAATATVLLMLTWPHWLLSSCCKNIGR